MGIDPVTITAIASVVSTAVGAVGAYQQSQSAKAQANYQAAIANNNAIAARQNAERIRQEAEIAEDEQRERIQRTKGAAKVALAANGLLVDDTADSTAQMTLQDIAAEGEYDVLRLRDKYAQEERAALLQGTNYDAQGALMRLKADQQNSFMAAGSTLLEGAGSVYGAGKDAGWWGSTTTRAPASAGSTTNTGTTINRSMWNR